MDDSRARSGDGETVPKSDQVDDDVTSSTGEDDTNEEEGSIHQDTRTPPNRRRWRDRKSIRALYKTEKDERHAITQEADRRDNDVSRLPPNEEVHLGGFVLVEAFTPSKINSLRRSIERLPVRQIDDKRQEWLDSLRDRRSVTGGGSWHNLGVVRQPGEFIATGGFHDPTLPVGIKAVWLSMHHVTPSLSMVVATFTLDEEAANLSKYLRRDYQTEWRNIRIYVPGRLGKIRSRIPWARPARYGSSKDQWDVGRLKREACEQATSEYEESCWRWFSSRFRGGRLCDEPIMNRPCIRLVFTKDKQPFKERLRYFSPVGLDFTFPWRSVDETWALDFDSLSVGEKRRFTATVAARRSDVAREVSPGQGTQEGKSLWYLTQEFHDRQSSLAVDLAASSLISLYGDRLGWLRDRAASRRRFFGPVRQGRELDKFLLGDGLDASTVASDLKSFAKKVSSFNFGAPEYVKGRNSADAEADGSSKLVGAQPRGTLFRMAAGLARVQRRQGADRRLTGHGEAPPGRQLPPTSTTPKDEGTRLVPEIREVTEQKSARVLEDMATVTANIRASAELRQSMANTRLQRVVVALAVIATITAVISLVISLKAS